jgi:hypothetical protein
VGVLSISIILFLFFFLAGARAGASITSGTGVRGQLLAPLQLEVSPRVLGWGCCWTKVWAWRQGEDGRSGALILVASLLLHEESGYIGAVFYWACCMHCIDTGMDVYHYADPGKLTTPIYCRLWICWLPFRGSCCFPHVSYSNLYTYSILHILVLIASISTILANYSSDMVGAVYMDDMQERLYCHILMDGGILTHTIFDQ